jgi:hypothetical protein
MIHCPSCGTAVDEAARLCPQCHELLPAPATVVGYGKLPDAAAPLEAPPTPNAKLPAPELAPEPAAAPRADAARPEPPPPVEPPPPYSPPAPTLDDEPAGAPMRQAARIVPGPGRPAAHHRSGTENVAPLRSALDPMPAAGAVAGRKHAAVGAVVTGWSLLTLLAAVALSALHAVSLVAHGYWNNSDGLLLTAWLSFAWVVPSAVMLAAGVSMWMGRGAPRALAVAGALLHTAWSAAASQLLASQFRVEAAALWAIVAAGLLWLASLGCMALAFAFARPRIRTPHP